MTRKQRFLLTVEAASIEEAIEQAESLIMQQGSETSSIFVGSNLGDICVEIIPPAHLVAENHTDVVTDLCDICGSVTVMGVNDIFLEGFKPSLVCTDCFDTDREGVRTRCETSEEAKRHRV
jgi:formate dehydrogenase maturation protein FdhE